VDAILASANVVRLSLFPDDHICDSQRYSSGPRDILGELQEELLPRLDAELPELGLDLAFCAACLKQSVLGNLRNV